MPLFLLSALLAVVVCFGCRYLVNATAYWLQDVRGPMILWTLGSGVLGFLHDGFLEPLHGYLLGQHVSTSMIFDLGVYLAVLGLVMVAVNLLGAGATTGEKSGEGTRERTDEAVEGKNAFLEKRDPNWDEFPYYY